MKGSVVTAEQAMAYAAHVSKAGLAVCSDAAENHLKGYGVRVMRTSSFADSVAAGTAALAGKRVFLSAKESGDLSYAVSMRLPLVCASFSYNVGSWPLFATSTLQELTDTVVQSYKIAENNKVLLPISVAFDGYASVREPVQLPTEQSIKSYVGRYKIPHPIDTKKRHTIVPQEDTVQQQMAAQNIFAVSKKAEDAWKKKFHRSYGLFESYEMGDAETVLVAYGFQAPTVKAAVDVLRKDGKLVGMLRLRLLNPLPPETKQLLAGKRVVAFDNFMEHGEGFAASEFGGQSVIFEKHLNEEDVITALKKSETGRLWVR